MTRRIVVSSNCQTGGLAAALGAMLPTDTVVPAPCFGMEASDDALRRSLAGAQAWVTAADEALIGEFVADDAVTVLRVPTIFFRGFHPDTIWVADADGNWLPSPAGRMHSAIIVWGWRNGLARDDIIARFSDDVFAALGYTSAWQVEVERVRDVMEPTDVAFEDFFLRIRERLPFMFTVNHPRLRVLVELARPIARLLGAAPVDVEFRWEELLADALLESGPVWPVYPAIAEALGTAGGLVWRRWGGSVIRLEEFVDESLRSLSTADPATITAPVLDDPRFDRVLGGSLVSS